MSAGELAIAPASAAIALASDLARRTLYESVLSGRNANSARAYAGDYEDFARYLAGAGYIDEPSPATALDLLVSLRLPLANACALAYRAHLSERKLSSATIARRLAALRSAVRLARQLGRVDWALEVESPRPEAYRETAGPGRAGWKAVLDDARASASTAIGRRDLALVRLLRDLALRRKEAIGLDLADVDLAGGTIRIVGKGKTAKAPVTLPGPARAALADWIAARGPEAGPLFTRLDNGGRGERLTGRGVHKIVGGIGRRAGLSRPLAPHQLRHAGITAALDATGGDVRSVQRFSRHAKVETVMRYDDNRADLGGKVAELISDA